ncbi:MAG: hypothetical protein RAO92_02035 [Candidatus Euphemobacter frigidus]|nr:hypothetical protein [Candidatus Euphemobacter frigidus]
MEYLEGQEMGARINSLKGDFDIVKVLTAQSASNIVVEYKGRKCSAIFNGITNCLYVDDVYGLIEG